MPTELCVKRFSGVLLLGLGACNAGDDTFVTGEERDPNAAGGGNVTADAGDVAPPDGPSIDPPSAPLLMPPDGCPSERFEHGICQPVSPIGPGDACASLNSVCPAQLPNVATWSCPLGWHQVAPLS